MSDEIVKKLDAYEALSQQEQIALGVALYDMTKLKGWEMLQALLRSTRASAALQSLKDKEHPREYYEGLVDGLDGLEMTIKAAVRYAEVEGEKAAKLDRRAGVLNMLRPGGGSL